MITTAQTAILTKPYPDVTLDCFIQAFPTLVVPTIPSPNNRRRPVMPPFSINIKFNEVQSKEMGKALFNAGNLCFSALILGQVVSGKFSPQLFIMGIICFAAFFTAAILVLTDRRLL